MQVWEILLLALAVSMDACAVAMTDGMCEAKMPLKRALLVGVFFGAFQMLMPIIGYFVAALVANVFLQTFEKISAWVSFALLAFLGGKMLIESIVEIVKAKREKEQTEGAGTCPIEKDKKKPWVLQLTLQAVATSIDALAVGVTLKMAALSEIGLAMGVWGSTAVIGAVTCGLSIAAVFIGKKVGNKLADKAGLLGGAVLLAIGIKILIEGLI
ncbi:MAG: manganese efflux pump [Clostridia bacterium]|nr:manganese efflux pump [Clostridia bacterium]